MSRSTDRVAAIWRKGLTMGEDAVEKGLRQKKALEKAQDLSAELKVYGPGERSEDKSHTAIVLNMGKHTVRALTSYAKMKLPIGVYEFSTAEFKTWHEPTPHVPPERIAELFVAQAKHLGATPEALDWLGKLVKISKQEYETMARKAKEDSTANDEVKAPAKAKKGSGLEKAAKAGKAKADAKTPAKAKKAVPANFGKPRRDPATKLTVNQKENPYREGTKAAATFEQFKKCKNVGAFMEAVEASPESFDKGYLNYASRDGYITLG